MPNAINRGSINLPTAVSNEILQTAIQTSAVMRLARRITLPGAGVTIPIITGDPSASWVNELGKKPVSNSGAGTKIMRAYTLAVIEAFSNQFARDYSALYDAMLERLPMALAQKFDATVFGPDSGKPGSDFDTLGGATAQDLGASTGAYAALVAARTTIATSGRIMNGIALSPQAEGLLLNQVDGNKRPLFIDSVADGDVPRILGVPTHITKAAYVASSPATKNTVGVAGDWTQAMYGTVEGVQISLSSQATLEIDGEQVNLWQNNMFAVRAEIEVGFRADVSAFNLLTVSA